MKAEAGMDRVCGELVVAIREGFPEKKNWVEKVIKPFYSMRCFFLLKKT